MAAQFDVEFKPTESRIDGVGVLRFPNAMVMRDGRMWSAADLANFMAAQIRSGHVLPLPSDRDASGNPLWDFRIEGNAVTLRDRFAMAALQGMLAGETESCNYHQHMNPLTTAESAYEFADAMLQARETKED